MRKLVTILAATALVLGAAPVASSGPAEQGAGRSIVFARSTQRGDVLEAIEIFIMEADGTAVRLTHNGTEDNFAELSPDGSRIAFARWTRRGGDIFVMRSDGTGVRRLTSFASEDVLPSWSPDGRWLAFTRTYDSRAIGWQSDIFTIRVADGALRRVTDTPRIKEFAPEWSPDGTAIAFTKHDPIRERYGIATAPPEGGASWLVVNDRSSSGYTDANPTWSPDSQWVAFAREHGDDPYVDIFKVRRDGTEVTAVTTLFELAENPSWGPDGRILFQHDSGIAVVGGDGGEITHVTPTRTTRPFHWPDW